MCAAGCMRLTMQRKTLVLVIWKKAGVLPAASLQQRYQTPLRERIAGMLVAEAWEWAAQTSAHAPQRLHSRGAMLSKAHLPSTL